MSRRDEWRRRVERYILFGGPPPGDDLERTPTPPARSPLDGVGIPDIRWLDALALAAFERTADRLDRPGPNQTIAAMRARGDGWQAMRCERRLDLDPRVAEWCWPDGGERWDVEDLLPPPSR